MKRNFSDTPDKPVLDESSFQQLLSAAYVLQQHKERQQAGKEAESSFSKVLNRVLEIQARIRNGRLDLQAASALVAKSAREFTEASGAAIGILEGDDLEYFAATGSAAGELGSRAPADLSLSSECLATRLVLRSVDTENDLRVRPELCRPLGIRAFIAAPIVFEAAVSGVLELHFARSNSMRDQDVRVAELLASLLSEAVGHERALHSRRPPAVVEVVEQDAPEEASEGLSNSGNDQAAMLAALEKIKPQLQRLAGVTSGSALGARSSAPAQSLCDSCGQPLVGNDPLCSGCGAARRSAKTWSSLWDLQREAEKSGTLPPAADEDDAATRSLDVLPSELEDIVASFSAEGPAAPPTKPFIPAATPFSSDAVSTPARNNGNGAARKTVSAPPANYREAYQSPSSLPSLAAGTNHSYAETEGIFPADTETDAEEAPETYGPAHASTVITRAQPNPNWDSAATVKAWFETEHHESWLAAKWRAQRANFYVAVSAGLLLAVLFGFDAPTAPTTAPVSTASNKKAAARKAAPAPELSPSEKLLVGLGLAEAPQAPLYRGNPDTKVWVDVHTALYYCPGSGFYGKSNGGRYTSQKDAQEDNFQPALRRACD